MIQVTALVVFVMLAAVLITELGPIMGISAWLVCYGLFTVAARALREHVWPTRRHRADP